MFEKIVFWFRKFFPGYNPSEIFTEDVENKLPKSTPFTRKVSTLRKTKDSN